MTAHSPLKDRMAAIACEVHDLLQDLKGVGGYWALAGDILKQAEKHVVHASRAASAAEAIEFHRGEAVLGSAGSVLVRTGEDRAVRIPPRRSPEHCLGCKGGSVHHTCGEEPDADAAVIIQKGCENCGAPASAPSIHELPEEFSKKMTRALTGAPKRKDLQERHRRLEKRHSKVLSEAKELYAAAGLALTVLIDPKPEDASVQEAVSELKKAGVVPCVKLPPASEIKTPALTWEERQARIQASRCPDCGCSDRHHYADCPRKK